MTQTHSAAILPFDPTRVRPGIRDLLIEARLRISDSVDSGEWLADHKMTPDLIAGQIPSLERLFVLDDGAVSRAAIKTSLLSLHAIHAGIWQSVPSLSFFMNLQLAAARLQEHPALMRKDQPRRAG
jgi:hypothetical protein